MQHPINCKNNNHKKLNKMQRINMQMQFFENYNQVYIALNKTFEPCHVLKSKTLEDVYFIDKTKQAIIYYPNDYELIYERCDNGAIKSFINN